VKVKGVITWVAAADGVPADDLALRPPLHRSRSPKPAAATTWTVLNPEQPVVTVQGWLEPGPGPRAGRPGGALPVRAPRLFRQPTASTTRADRPVFNLSVGLRDGWTK
jgi:glutaminyl-tRNA synthetase